MIIITLKHTYVPKGSPRKEST